MQVYRRILDRILNGNPEIVNVNKKMGNRLPTSRIYRNDRCNLLQIGTVREIEKRKRKNSGLNRKF